MIQLSDLRRGLVGSRQLPHFVRIISCGYVCSDDGELEKICSHTGEEMKKEAKAFL